LHRVPNLDEERPLERTIDRPFVARTHVEDQRRGAVADADASAAGPRGRRAQVAGVAGQTVAVGTSRARVTVAVAISIPRVAVAVAGVAVAITGVAVAVAGVAVAVASVFVSISVTRD